MNQLTLFILEIAISFCISLIVVLLLKPLLTDILVEICGTAKRAAFWGMFSQLMLFIAPFLIVVYFAPTYVITDNNVVLTFKETLFHALLGVFVALASVGQVIWKSIDLTSNESATDITVEE